MKKFLLAILAAAMTMTAAAQPKPLKVFNHLGVDLGVGTTGIDATLSTTITDFVQMRAGLSIMPNISFKAEVDGEVEYTYDGQKLKDDFDMKINAGLGRTQGEVIFNVYPMGRMSSFFVAAGAYFGGKKIIGIDGHSPKVEQLQNEHGIDNGYIEIGDYKIDFEKGGKVQGGLVVQNFRPYFGLGFGRPCPKGRVGFMFELGVQVMGKMKVCQGKDLTPIDISNINNDDDWQKWMDKISVYPVLKFTLTGRIL